MCEACEMCTVFLGKKSLYGFAFLCVVEEEGVGTCGGEKKLSLVVEVEGGYMSI